MYLSIKRLLDIVCSIVFIILLSPLFIVIIGFIQKNIFYFHPRVGFKGRLFKVIKFRSMKVDNRELKDILKKDQLDEYYKNYKIKNDPRITRVGRVLRRLSLDELPQLFNILKGEMSFVGPRPITIEEINRLDEKKKACYLSVKPGLTGLWAVNGRSSIDFDKRIDYEIFYVNNRSFWLDLKIIIKTIFVFFKDSL